MKNQQCSRVLLTYIAHLRSGNANLYSRFHYHLFCVTWDKLWGMTNLGSETMIWVEATDKQRNYRSTWVSRLLFNFSHFLPLVIDVFIDGNESGRQLLTCTYCASRHTQFAVADNRPEICLLPRNLLMFIIMDSLWWLNRLHVSHWFLLRIKYSAYGKYVRNLCISAIFQRPHLVFVSSAYTYG